MAEAVIEQANGLVQVGPFTLTVGTGIAGQMSDHFLDLLAEAADQVAYVPEPGDEAYQQALAELAEAWAMPLDELEPVFRAWVASNRWDWQQSYWLALTAPEGPAIMAESEGE